MDALNYRYRRLREVGPWLALEPLLPGATLFLLLVWLSAQFLRDGFASVRQHAFPPHGASWIRSAPALRNWWSCTCAGGTCVCASLARSLRRCCAALAAGPMGGPWVNGILGFGPLPTPVAADRA